jgi:hypothetical protein
MMESREKPLMERKRIVRKLYTSVGVPEREWAWFTEWLEGVSPKGTSNQPRRELLWATWQDTNEDFRKKATEKEMPVRCISWMKRWIKVLGVKRGKFDRYKCHVCYFGKLAEARVREGTTR